jgi:glutamate synthase (NADPH) large chain
MAETPQNRNRSVTALLPEGLPEASGLYDPRREHDACGIGLIASISNDKSHRIIADGLNILRNLEHRGAVGADARAGDGCGMLIQIPHALFAEEAVRLGFALPEPGDYGVGFLFMPREPAIRNEIERIWWETAREEGLKILGWRDVPVDSDVLGPRSRRPSRSRARCSSAAGRRSRRRPISSASSISAARWCRTG